MIGIVCAANRPGGYDEEIVNYLKPFLATCTTMVKAYGSRVKRLEAEEAIRKYAEELEESNRMKDLFTDILRHDLMNPVNVVINFAELLLSEESDPRKREMVEEIYLGQSAQSSYQALVDAFENRQPYIDMEDYREMKRDGTLKKQARKAKPKAGKKLILKVRKRR